MSKLEAEVTHLRISLDKRVDGGATESEVEDVLKALQKVVMTIDILRATKVGKSVSNVMKTFDIKTAAGALADKIVAEWKVIADKAKKSEKKEEKTETASGNKMPGSAIAEKLESNRLPTAAPAPSSSSSNVKVESEFVVDTSDERYGFLDDLRRKIVSVFVERLSGQCANAAIASSLAYTIEASIHKMHNSNNDRAAYTAKARSLAFNLKQNEQLREDIAVGNVPAEALVLFTQAQLATAEKREAMKKGEEDAVMERRSDYFKLVRDKLCKENGIDPEQGGQFRCRKCNGNKTTNYQMQTRSADEPMTVFITCLKCGHKWRE
jgi:transcription elongation factor S-II